MKQNFKLTKDQQTLVEKNLSIVHWVIVNNIHVNPGIVGKSGLAEPQASFLKQISVLQTTDAGIYMDVVDNDPVNDG